MIRYLGIDLGGTNIKGAVIGVDPESTPSVVATRTEATQADRGPAVVAQRMIDLGNRMAAMEGPFAGVGIGVPGLFDFDTGEIVFFTNLSGAWEGQG